LILHNANIHTLNDSQPHATAIAIDGHRISAVGNDETVLQATSPDATIMDMNGNTIVPGLADSHGHMSGLGLLSVEFVNLRDAKSYEEVVELVRERAQTTPAGQWIQGRAWNQENWPDKSLPTHDLLSKAIPDHPVWIVRVDAHAGVANAHALRISGITEATPNPVGGVIGKDGDRLNGLFLDVAMGLIRAHIPKITVEKSKQLLMAAQTLCLAAGLTQVHDAGIDETMLQAYRELVAEGNFKIRVYAMLARDYFDGANASPIYDGLFTCRSVKIVSDGALGSRGAALLAPYSDAPDQSGFLLLSRDDFEATVERAFASGFQVNTHAIGDLANRESLDVVEAALKRHEISDHRSRIEHAQHLHLDDISRFSELGIIASIQPTHCTSDMFMADSRLGAERNTGAYPWRKFLDSGARIVGGSDFPVESNNPLWGIYSAVTRQNHDGQPSDGWHPEERLTMDEALRSFTLDAAYASFQEDDLGELAPGKLADLTVLDTDITNEPPQALLDTSVIMTIVNGEVVYAVDSAQDR
jgi:predicted amidohydrolase YtcJ